MKTTGIIFMAFSAFIIFSGAAAAADNVLLAFNKPAKAVLSVKTAELASAATGQVMAQPAESEDFDALSEVNDPLYREGSKEFLEQVYKQDEVAADKKEPARKEPVNETLRDAPNSVPAAAPTVVKARAVIRKPKLKKVIPADPVKGKNTL